MSLESTFDQIVIAMPKITFESNLGKSKNLCGFNIGTHHPLQLFYKDCLKCIFETSINLSFTQQEMLSDHLLNMMTCIVGDEYPKKNLHF